jgi:hypothetical protein
MKTLRRDQAGLAGLISVLILAVLAVAMFAILFAIFGGGIPAPGAPTCVLSGRVFAPGAVSATVTITQGGVPVAWTSVDPRGATQFNLNLGCVSGMVATASAAGYSKTVSRPLAIGGPITSDWFYANLAT